MGVTKKLTLHPLHQPPLCGPSQRHDRILTVLANLAHLEPGSAKSVTTSVYRMLVPFWGDPVDALQLVQWCAARRDGLRWHALCGALGLSPEELLEEDDHLTRAVAVIKHAREEYDLESLLKSIEERSELTLEV